MEKVHLLLNKGELLAATRPPGARFCFKNCLFYTQGRTPLRTSLRLIMPPVVIKFKLMLVVLRKTCLNNTCSEAYAK